MFTRTGAVILFPPLALLLAVALPRPAHALSERLLIAPTGGAANEYLGASVAGAGDFNGDGYADVLVGAVGYNGGGTDRGKAVLYFGGGLVDSTADLAFVGAVDYDEFGVAVASAGDLDGDGYDDVAIGAMQYSVAPGYVHVYLGGPTPDAVPDLVLVGEASGDEFGSALAPAGDFDGDGYEDLLVGARRWGALVGRAYLYLGGGTPDATADFVFTGGGGGTFGLAVAGAGDFNDDGYDDVIVGEPEGSSANPGRAQVYFGGPAADSTADLTFVGQVGGDYFGFSVSSAGDFNGDGVDDILVGATRNEALGFGAGRAYVYFGGSDPDTLPDVIFNAEGPSNDFGCSVAAIGDVNGDGYGDVLVGAEGNDTADTDAGRAYIYLGGPTADSSPDLVLPGIQRLGRFGASVASAGDADGDGFGDVIIGAWGIQNPGIGTGRAYLYALFPLVVLSPNGGESWIVGETADVRWRGRDVADLALSTDGGFSWDVLRSGIGGANENRLSLLAPWTPTSAALVRLSVTGEPVGPGTFDTSDDLFRILLPETTPAVAHRLHVSSVGAIANDQLGGCVSRAGDVNGDGFDDVVAGAAYNDAVNVDAGRAYVWLGGPSEDPGADVTLNGAAAGDEFGHSCSGAGDFNGDGFDDLIVGAHWNDAGGADAGAAYVYFGGTPMSTVPDVTLVGEAAGDRFGYSVSGAGDVDADGFDDVIVGAYFNGAGGSQAGRAYIYRGGSSPDAVPDLVLTGLSAGDQFGRAVSGAGDVDGDGFDDVLVGARYNDDAGGNAGAAYVYFGAASLDETPDVAVLGEAANDQFGFAVSAAGDVNGDGFGDVLVGARVNDAGGTDAGRAYLYLGGEAPDSLADLVLTGDAVGDFFATVVASAGDVNHDGYDDVLVGAPRNDAGGSEAGRVSVWFGGPVPDAAVDLVLTSSVAGEEFGESAATAGDFNGDGFDDLCVGAYSNDELASNGGAVYIFDCNRYFLEKPDGGETWNVGAIESISWQGAEMADLWLSSDGGATSELVFQGVGGDAENTVPFLVPHRPSRFSIVRVTPSDGSVSGFDRSDSLFTIEASIVLLSFRAAPPADGGPGVEVAWSTEPGPEKLAGYRLEKANGPAGWRTLLDRTTDTGCTDPEGTVGARYRLTAINGLGEEYVLGETGAIALEPLAAWPQPYRGGELTVSFATLGALGGGAAPAEVGLYDVAGRLVRRIVRGDFEAGYHGAAWDGRDDGGAPVASGIYFLRLVSAGNSRTVRVVVLR